MEKLEYKEEPLSPKQRKWVHWFLKTGNAREACRQAGYSIKSASALKKNERVRKAIQEAIEHRKKQFVANIDREYLLEKMKEIAENEAEKTSDRLKALELLGKALGIFTEKIEQRVEAVKYYAPEKREDL